MYNREEFINLLKEIGATGGETDNMAELLQKLRDDFDEREAELRKFGEEEDKENPESEKVHDKIKGESERDNVEDNGERRNPVSAEEFEKMKLERDAARKAYFDRFFSSETEIKEDTKEDVKRDGKPQTFDELFEKREG